MAARKKVRETKFDVIRVSSLRRWQRDMLDGSDQYGHRIDRAVIKNIGGLPCAYIFMALFADGLDHVEWKSGIRCDDTAMSVYNIIAVAVVGIATAAFEPLKLCK